MDSRSGIQQSMLAIDIRHPGGPEVLIPALHPVPQPERGCILVKVEAAGVNPRMFCSEEDFTRHLRVRPRFSDWKLPGKLLR